MRVIGTAGHVDHGKSTLVQAITGTHPDRLKEEREREMTIDLGFAWFNLPDGEEVGIVDVPGHRDFIENMLAGVGGIDAALFVVAADEGVMPQTREHLAILDILQVQGGVVALTKIDMVDDPDWVDLVEMDLRQTIMGTVLERAPIVRVSGRTGAGVPELLDELSTALADHPPRPDLGRPRLPIDRIFTISGFGTVVTGTLTDGQLKVGEEIEILPQKLSGRIRGLQTHKRKENIAIPGSRTAVNISGIALEQFQRGNVLTHPGDYKPSRRLDVRFRLLPDVSTSLRHNTEVKLFIGAAEIVARMRLLGTEELLPGETGWLQLELTEPVVAIRGDRYILRRPSPGETLGGGLVVDALPKGRHKRFAAGTLSRLEALSHGSPSEVLFQALVSLGAAPVREVVERSNLDSQSAPQALSELLDTNQILALEGRLDTEAPLASDALIISKGYWEQLADRNIQEVEKYHRSFPLRPGMPREELKSRLRSTLRDSTRLFNTVVTKLVAEEELVESGPLVKRPGHSIQFTNEQKQRADRLLARFAQAPYTPPSVKECISEVGEDLFSALIDSGQLVQVSSEVVFRQADYDRMVAEIRNMVEERGKITAAEVRDHFNTSRRYVLALLEHLDAIGLTIREGDYRRLKK